MIKTDKFVFQKAVFNPAISGFEFTYRVEAGEKEYTFTDNLIIPGPEVHALWSKVPEQIQKSLLDSLHLMLGVQYWSMFATEKIEIESTELTALQANFWDTVYTRGLGEFFYVNQIDWRGLVKFPYTQTVGVSLEPYQRGSRSLLAFGGGKDSIVAAEMLKQKGEDFSLFSLGAAAVQVAAAEIVGKKLTTPRRRIDSMALYLLRDKKVYSGHIPYTAIYTFTGLLMAILFDFSRLVFANEKSADEGNLEYLGMQVNHQWSKSSEFETLVKKYVTDFVTKDVEVYSLLRPYSELEITKKFVDFPQYHHTFSSCNANFAPGIKSSTSPYWCGHCAKCAFVFTALAAYMPKDEVVSIVGKDMFADRSLLPIFEQLAGLRDFKPFECVGTVEEMRLALDAAVGQKLAARYGSCQR
ncbi:MAG: endonuclease domain-containing protein [Candidatus Pacebacteria bacterium]|nr:endonuclease domain-containing protein [Candidatus Paceibacterota bacterium]